LIGNCVWPILRVLCGLKEEFYGEIKHRFLGFWFEKERREGYLGTLRRNEMKMEYKAFNPTDNKMNNSKPQIHH